MGGDVLHLGHLGELEGTVLCLLKGLLSAGGYLSDIKIGDIEFVLLAEGQCVCKVIRYEVIFLPLGF